jgi:hypothetical protein
VHVRLLELDSSWREITRAAKGFLLKSADPP